MKYFFIAIGFTIVFMAGIFIPGRAAHAATSTVINPSIETNNNSANGTTFTDVFVNSSTGYAFFRDANGRCGFQKTTNGGGTWATEKIIDSKTGCLRVAVWYDRWTPGNTTGTLINVATIDNSSDDAWYEKLDTSNDTTSTPLDISGGAFGGSYTAGTVLQSITRATNGTLYEGLYNTGANFILRCSATGTLCQTSSTKWTLAGSTATDYGTLANDWMALAPLPNGNILNTRFVISTGSVQFQIWNNGSSSWSTPTRIDSSCPLNTTYDGGFGQAVNSISNNIYMAYVCNNKTISANTGAIRTQTFFAASSTWTRDADAETSSTLGLTGTKLGLDINTGDIYVVYTGETTIGTTASMNVYYKIATSTTMAGWGTRQGPINATTSNIYGARIDGMSSARLYATWVDGNADSLNGQTIAIFSPNTFTQTAYEFYQNEDDTQVGNNFDNENASSVIPLAGNPFRLRMLVAVGGTGIDVDAQSFNLQYATSSDGACATDFSDGLTYVDVGTATSSLISYYQNAGISNNTALTANGQDPTDGTNVIVNETYVSQNSFSDHITKILGGQDGKWDFSLVNNSATTGQNFCFRIVNSDDSQLSGGYSVVASAQVDAAPTISGVTLNGGNSITLIEGTTTMITATATVSDANGYADIYSISGVLYRTSSSSSCTANNNDCYIGTGANCSINSCAGTTCNAYCTYNVWYYAQPTDAGTPWSGDSWTALVQASDTVFSGVSATSSGINLLSLLAFTTTSTINYGSLNQNQSMSTLTASSVIVSSGNDAMNVTVYGTNMTSGGFSIPVGQQQFATSSVTYGSGTTLLANPGSTVLIDLAKPTSSAGTKSTFYWGIGIPSGQMATSYTGGNSFIGVEAPLPWP